MSRSVRCLVLALGLVTTFIVLGGTAWADPTVGGDTPATPKSGTTAPAQSKEVMEAIELFKLRKYDECATMLETAGKKDPELPPAQIIMFQLFAQTQQPFLARMALEKAIINAPDDPEAFVILGNIALQERRVTEAEFSYNKATQLLKKFDKSKKRKDILEPQTLNGLAGVAEAREKWDVAQSFLESLLKASPKDTGAMQRIARAHFQLKAPGPCLEKLREAYKTDSQNVLPPELILARFYQQYPDPENAKIWFSNALKKYGEDVRVRLGLAQYYLETGKLDDALTHAAKAQLLDPKSLDAKILRGIVALFREDYPSAEKYFEDAHLQSPGNFAASNNLALALCEQADDAKKRRALEYAKNNYQQNPKNGEALSTLGWVIYRSNPASPNLDEAENALRMAAQAGPLSPDSAYYLAQIWYDRAQKGDTRMVGDAKAMLEVTLKQDRPFSMRRAAAALLDKVTPLADKAKREATSKKDNK